MPCLLYLLSNSCIVIGLRATKSNGTVEDGVMVHELLDVSEHERVSIEEWPETVNSRCYFGHWEGNLILSRDGLETPVFVLVERKTSFLVIIHLSSSKPTDMIKVIDYFMLLHQNNVVSLTFGIGSEFISWDCLERIQLYYGKKTYFTHPNSPQECGSTELKNKMIQQCVGYTNYDQLTQLDWDIVAQLINNEPMRIVLDGESPMRLYASESKERLRSRNTVR